MFRSIPFILMVQMGLFGAICFTAYQNNDWTFTPTAAAWTVSYLCLILFLDMCRSDENWLQQTYSLLFIVTCCLAGGSFVGYPQSAFAGWVGVVATAPAYHVFGKYIVPNLPIFAQRPFYHWWWKPTNLKTAKKYLVPNAYEEFERVVINDGLLDKAFDKGGITAARAAQKEWVEKKANEEKSNNPLAAMLGAMLGGKIQEIDLSGGKSKSKFNLDPDEIDKAFRSKN